MANSILAKMAVEIVANTASFARGLEAASNQAKKFQNQIKLVGGAVLGAIAFKEIAGEVIRITAQFEKFGAVLQNALGSRSAAQQALRSISKFAAKTPFEVGEITAAYVRWTNQGLKPSIEKMTMLGDVATALGAGFEQTAEAFKDLAVGQTRRLEEVGISAVQSNGKIQLSFKGVNLEIEKNADGVNKALAVYSKLPGVLGTSAAVSQTLGGKISNLQDNLTILANTIGTSSGGLIGGFIDFANSALGGLNDALNKQSDALRKEQIELNVLVAAITDVNTTNLARKSLIEELNRKYPDFLKNLDIEKVTNEQISQRLEDVNKQFLKKIALAVAEERLIDKQKELNDAIDDEVQARKDLALAGNKQEILGTSGQFISAAESAQTRIFGAQQRQKKAQEELNELVSRYTKTWQEAENANLEYFNTSNNGAKAETKNIEKSTEAIKKEEQAWNDLMKIRSMSLDDLKKQYKEQQTLTGNVSPISPVSIARGAGTDSVRKTFAKQIEEYTKRINAARDANAKFQKSIAELNGAFALAASQGLQDFFVGLGDVANGQISFGENILKALYGFMQQFGQALIALGIAKLNLDRLFTSGPTGAVAAIAAGTALVVAAGAVKKSMARKAESIGNGTTSGFTGQTINASGMQTVQITGTLVGSGRDLVAVINNTSFDNKVRKGG